MTIHVAMHSFSAPESESRAAKHSDRTNLGRRAVGDPGSSNGEAPAKRNYEIRREFALRVMPNECVSSHRTYFQGCAPLTRVDVPQAVSAAST